MLPEIKGTLYNLHSHTEYCDGRATMEAFARQAVRDGFEVYGFTPHSPIPFLSPCNMLARNVDRFLVEADRIAVSHPETLFLKGMEIDFLGEEWGPAHSFFRSLPLDYSIGSVHFIRNQKGDWIDVDGSHESFAKKLAVEFNGNLQYVIDTFFANSLDMVAAGGFDIIGHLDKIADNAAYISPGIDKTPEFRQKVLALIDAVSERGDVAIEINTKKYESGNRFFPDPYYWDYIRAKGISIYVNSDAHVPALINSGRDEALKILGL